MNRWWSSPSLQLKRYVSTKDSKWYSFNYYLYSMKQWAWGTWISCSCVPNIWLVYFHMWVQTHYSDVIMTTMASQIISFTIIYSTVYSGTDQRKHQSSASLASVRGIHRSPVNSPYKGPVTRKLFPFDDVIMLMTLSVWGTWISCSYIPKLCLMCFYLWVHTAILPGCWVSQAWAGKAFWFHSQPAKQLGNCWRLEWGDSGLTPGELEWRKCNEIGLYLWCQWSHVIKYYPHVCFNLATWISHTISYKILHCLECVRWTSFSSVLKGALQLLKVSAKFQW